MPSETLVAISDLKVNFYTYRGVIRALDGINLEIRKGETLGVVGETGSGKSVTALSIIRLVPDPPGKIDGGTILLNGQDLLKKSNSEMLKIRGGSIAMVFQDPSTFLNPVITIGDQISETVIFHQSDEFKLKGKALKRKVKERTIELLKMVRMPDPVGVLKKYPHELSGGMRQRAMIAMAIACRPQLLIADEPTTALDVTIQAQILDLLNGLKEKIGSSILMITHDLGIVAETCDRAAIMYAGNIVELGPTRLIFENPLHPYTKALLKAIPKINESRKDLEMIPGSIPNLLAPPSGCRFHPRCPHAMQKCSVEKPKFLEMENEHFVACYLY